MSTTLATGSLALHARVAAEAAEYTTDLPTIHSIRFDTWDVVFQGHEVAQAKTLALRLGLNVQHADVREGDRAVTTIYAGKWSGIRVQVIAYVLKADQS